METPVFVTPTPLRIAVLTISDTRTVETDKSGGRLIDRLQNAGHKLAARAIVPDDREAIAKQLREWQESGDVQIMLTTGGTGITGRDVTPDVVESLCEKMIPGFGELFRMLSYEKIGTSTIQSRCCAGVFGNTLIFALPGSTGAVTDAWDGILQQQLDIRHKPCNFAELLPRLSES